ncbi:MAG: hypothetical protein E7172_00880 [Firmicutes bacterium]|nr:hypothetical protein [Bacillota bacterium]
MFDDKKIIYEDEYGKHEIYLEKKVYIKTNEDILKIDFQHQVYEYYLNRVDKFSLEIEGYLKKENNYVELMYQIDKDEIKLIIERVIK